VLAIFGINSDGLNLAVNMLILFLVVIWLALIYWTYMDAMRRIEDPMLVICATAASVFPFVGTILYVIVRPPEYLEDVREREVKDDFLRCPSCMRKLREPCNTCGRPLDPDWKLCPYCESALTDDLSGEGRIRTRVD
jgi:hypothetical protein